MYLKIFYEEMDVLTKDILYRLHAGGYRMELVCVGKNAPDDDGFLSFYSRSLTGPHIQLCLCNPKKLFKSFEAQKKIMFLFPNYEFDESDIEIFQSMDLILTANPLIGERLTQHGMKNSVNVQCFYDMLKVEKSKMEKYTFLSHFDWKEERGWKEMLFSYCNAFPDGSVDIIISTNMDSYAVNEQISRFLALNNFNRLLYPGIYVLSGKSFEEVFKFADCFVAPYLTNHYDQNVLTSMRCGTPLIISRLEAYQFFCRKSTCWVVDFINQDTLDTMQMAESMIKVVEDREDANRKTDMAKSFLESKFGREDLFSSIIGSINSFGARPVSDLSFEVNKKGNII